MERLTWVETKTNIKRLDGGIILRHPRLMNSTEWVDDMRRWPQVSYGAMCFVSCFALREWEGGLFFFESCSQPQSGKHTKPQCMGVNPDRWSRGDNRVHLYSRCFSSNGDVLTGDHSPKASLVVVATTAVGNRDQTRSCPCECLFDLFSIKRQKDTRLIRIWSLIGGTCHIEPF